MRAGRSMHPGCYRMVGCLLVGSILTFGLRTVNSAQGTETTQKATAPRPIAPLLDPNHLRMQPEQVRLQPEKPVTGSVRQIIFGDETKPGMYIHRVKFPKNYLTRPHFHDSDRWVLVLQGTWYTAEGPVFTPDTMIPIRAGGMMYHPRKLVHYDGTRDEEVIVQIMGHGPVTTTRLDGEGKKPQ